jgi:hypothetical protein
MKLSYLWCGLPGCVAVSTRDQAINGIDLAVDGGWLCM